MTRLFTLLFFALSTASIASVSHAQFGEGLPMTDQLGSGSGSVRSSGSGFASTPFASNRNSTAAPRTTYRSPSNNGFRPQITAQQMQGIANAAAALGPAINQMRANAQQIRAQNGGYLIPRNNQGGAGGGFLQNRASGNRNGGFFQNRQPWQGMNRYTDTSHFGDAQRVRQGLIDSGYSNVQIHEHPHNPWRRQNNLRPVYGVYHGR